jgi:hypothetical protein
MDGRTQILLLLLLLLLAYYVWTAAQEWEACPSEAFYLWRKAAQQSRELAGPLPSFMEELAQHSTPDFQSDPDYRMGIE